MDEDISFGKWLRQQRRALDLTQKSLADRVGCAEITIRRMEADAYKPSEELAFVLFEKLGISEAERPQWIRFARGLTEYPDHLTASPSFEHKTNLPVPLTSFIGRKKEQEEIKKLVTRDRLVTVSGIGGIGKTRLSIQIGTALLNEFSHGVWIVDLAPLTEPILVPQAIVNILELIKQTDRSPLNILIEFLRSRRTLLILDNCEHLIQACAQLSEKLLQACPDLHILATSREPFGIDGETVYPVPPLTTPDASSTTFDDLYSYESVQLFLERAQSALPGFKLTQENRNAVVQVCQHLDGIPLALELAAARVKLLRVEEIAAHLDERFRLLSGGSRTALPRHQTLEAMVDWSYNLLSSKEHVLLARLSVFTGGWTLDAAEKVCADEDEIRASGILDLLAFLVNKSLIISEREQGKGTRYSMLETIRQYAYEKLQGAGAVDWMRQQHLMYFVDFAERGNEHNHGSDQIEWMDRLEIEIDNFRSALDWCVSKQQTGTALRLLSALSWTWDWRGHFGELRSRFDQVRTLPDIADYPVPYARLLNHLADESQYAGDLYYARLVLKESQEIWLKLGAEGELGLARALEIMGEIALYDDKDIGTAQSFFEHSFDLYRKHKDKWGMAWLIYRFGGLAYAQNRYDDAEKYFLKSLTKFQELGDRSGAALVLSGLGEMARVLDDYERAGMYWKKNLKLFRELQGRFALAWPHIGLGWVALHTSEFERAGILFKEGLLLSMESGNEMNIALALIGLAGILGMTGKLEQAARLFGVVEAVGERLGRMEPADQKDFDHYVSVVRGKLEQPVFERAWTKGRGMTIEQATEYVLKQF